MKEYDFDHFDQMNLDEVKSLLGVTSFADLVTVYEQHVQWLTLARDDDIRAQYAYLVKAVLTVISKFTPERAGKNWGDCQRILGCPLPKDFKLPMRQPVR